MRLRRILRVCVLVLIGGLLWPRERVVVPQWTVTVLQNDRPAPGVMVRETWRDYSVYLGREEDRTTDRAGRVTFPRRVVRASPLHRTLGCFSQVVMSGVHASCGPSAFLSAYSTDSEGWETYEPGHPLPSTIILSRR